MTKRETWARAGEAAVCPFCGDGAQFDPLIEVTWGKTVGGVASMLKGPGYAEEQSNGGSRVPLYWVVQPLACTLCGRVIVQMSLHSSGTLEPLRRWRAYPALERPPKLPEEVPEDLRAPYSEAWALKTISPAASAVLARRCLQLALRKDGFTARSNNLADEIKAAEGEVSPELWQQLHIVRHVGTFGAHPTDAEGGTDYVRLLEVTPGEVDILFAAIDDYFMERFIRKERRRVALEATNKKLEEAGLKPITPPATPTRPKPG